DPGSGRRGGRRLRDDGRRDARDVRPAAHGRAARGAGAVPGRAAVRLERLNCGPFRRRPSAAELRVWVGESLPPRPATREAAPPLPAARVGELREKGGWGRSRLFPYAYACPCPAVRERERDR